MLSRTDILRTFEPFDDVVRRDCVLHPVTIVGGEANVEISLRCLVPNDGLSGRGEPVDNLVVNHSGLLETPGRPEELRLVCKRVCDTRLNIRRRVPAKTFDHLVIRCERFRLAIESRLVEREVRERTRDGFGDRGVRGFAETPYDLLEGRNGFVQLFKSNERRAQVEESPCDDALDLRRARRPESGNELPVSLNLVVPFAELSHGDCLVE